MRKLLSTFVALVCVTATTASAAEVRPGFGAALRVGYGLPMGKALDEPGADMSEVFSGTIPLQLDVGYRFSPAIAAAAYFQYALGLVKDTADSGSSMRAGIEGFWHFTPGQTWDFWAGLGVGYEWTKAKEKGAANDTTFKGFDANIQLGADYAVSPSFGIGPFVQFTAGQYSSADNGTVSADINNKAFHEWLQFGVRGTFNL